jgi:hypothetical protein
MKKINSLLLLLTALLSSCEKVLDIENDPSQAQLVLNAVPSVDKQAFVYFAHTRFFLDTSNNQPVPDVSMTLTINGVPYSTPDSVVNCKYFFPYTYAEGDSLSIDVNAGGHFVHAHTYVPYLPTLSHLQLLNKESGSTFRYYLADFDFQDHVGKEEYYNLALTVRDSGVKFNEWKQKYDTVDTVHVSYFLLRNNSEITGNASNSIPMLGYLYTRNLFRDTEIDGQNYHVSMRILHLIDTNEVQPFKHEYTVSLESVTPARYRYIIDVSRQNSSGGFFSEQGPVRGNVEGALGIFAGSAKCKFTFWPDTLPLAPTSSKGIEPIEAMVIKDLETIKKKEK